MQRVRLISGDTVLTDSDIIQGLVLQATPVIVRQVQIGTGTVHQNTVLSVRVLNTASHTAHASTPELVTGSGGWSKEKIEKIKEMFAKI